MPENLNSLKELFSSGSAPFSIGSLMLNLLVGAVISFILKFHYKRYSSTLNNREEFGNIFPFILGLALSVGMYIGRYVYIGSNTNFILMYGSILGLIAVALWNLYLNKKSRQGSSCSACVTPLNNS